VAMLDDIRIDGTDAWQARWGRILAEFAESRVAVAALVFVALLVVLAILAPLVAPQNPYDLAQLSIMDNKLPPLSRGFSGQLYLLGTDDQGRDLLSTMLYGTRASLSIGLLATLLALVIGVTLGLVSGYFGGRVDMVIMRVADVQLTFPAILAALLVDGVARIVLRTHGSGGAEFWILVLAIGLSRRSIMLRHVLPNVTGPVLVIATINVATAILLEATLSFLGVGLPPTQPSLGTLINIGNKFLFSGEWWIVIFPGITLATLILAVNLLGDWLRDALNPKLR
jgi:peptide/nickel transport system permease protein